MKTIKKFEAFSGIEDKARLSDKIVKLLNKQIQNELESSQIYKAMACWLDEEGWPDATKYFFKAGQEELTHMDKIYDYLFLKNCRAVVPTSPEVKGEYKDIQEVVESSLDHEMKVSEQWAEISNEALAEKDNDTYHFAEWFVKEQQEEEEKFRDFLFKMRLDMPKYEIEKLFK